MIYNKFILLLVFTFAVKFSFGQMDTALITVSPSSQTVYLNEPVSVVVGVDGVVGLFAISVTLSFDNSIIKCLNITQGNFLINNAGGYDVFFETFPEDLYSANSVTVDQSILGLASVTGSGDVFEITFEPFAGGTSQIEVVSFSLRDINNQEIPAIAESAEINVIPSVAAVITLTPQSQSVSTSDPISLVVGVDGVIGLFAISVTLSFDNSIIKCLDITQGDFLINNGSGYDVFFETFPEDLYSANSVTVDQSILGLASVTGSGDVFEITFEPFAGGTTQVEVVSLSLRDINNQEIPAITDSAEIIVNTSVVNTKIFLQGPFNLGTMLTTLNSSGNLPLSQPYSVAPWNYPGIESVAAGFFTSHPEIVDWVLVEVRTGILAGTTVAKRAAFLKSDGTVVDLNSLDPVAFIVPDNVEYYIVLKHRNHLSLMSSISVLLNDSTPLYNFTNSQSKAYGVNAMVDLGGGFFGAYTADTDGSGTVNAADRSNAWNDRNLSGYLGTDVDLSGTVNAADRSTVWNNRNMSTQVPY